MMNERQLSASIGAGIRAWRKKAGLTISQLAELAGTDPGFLAYIETGKKMPSMVTAVKLAKALDISLPELFQDVKKVRIEGDYELLEQLRFLFHVRGPSERADLLAILKQFNDPGAVKALRRLIRK